jgi:hypothetical protein
VTLTVRRGGTDRQFRLVLVAAEGQD